MHISSSYANPTRSKEFMDFCSTLYPHGVTYMSHTVLDNSGNAEIFYSDLEWGKRYVEGRYIEKDAIMRHALNTKTLFIPWNCLLLNATQKEIYLERENDFRKFNGLALSFRNGPYQHALGFATDTPGYDLADYFRNHAPVLIDCLNLFKKVYAGDSLLVSHADAPTS